MMQLTRRMLPLAAVLLLAAACSPPGRAPAGPGVLLSPGAARNALASLPTSVDADYWADADYARDAFGPAWVDVDGNHCNTRDDALAIALEDVVLRSNGCYVDHGTLTDPYSGDVVYFVRGPDTSPLVQVDHVVSLWEAWGAGAGRWDDETRILFANDPRNLVATTQVMNEDKGALSISEWLPPQTGFHCEFALRLVTVKAAYTLAITDADRAAAGAALETCPE